MTTRVAFESSNEVGVFAKLTNSYCITAVGSSENFYSVFDAELGHSIKCISGTIAGTRIVGRMTAGTPLPPLAPLARSLTPQATSAVCSCPAPRPTRNSRI